MKLIKKQLPLVGILALLILNACQFEQVHINMDAPLTFEAIPFQTSDYLLSPYAIIEHEGGYAVSGSRTRIGQGTREGFLMRIDSLGVLRHHRQEKTQIHSMVPIDLGFMTAGYDGQSFPDYTLFVKSFIQAQGHIFEPDRSFSVYSIAYDLIQTRDGNFLVCGFTEKNNKNVGLLLKMGPFVETETVWQKLFAPENNGFSRTLYHVEERRDGSLLAFDGTKVLFLDENGNEQNAVTLDFFGTDSYHKRFIATNDGDFVLANNKNLSIDFPSSLIKFDATGQEILEKNYGNLYRFESLRPTSDGGFVVSGHTFEFGNGGVDAFLLKVDSELNQEWFETYGGPLNEYAYDAIQTADGGYIIVGSEESVSQTDALPGTKGLYLIKTDSKGLVR